MDAQRAAFEAFLGAGSTRDDFQTFSDSEYVDPATQSDWEVWKAARKQALQEVSMRVACAVARPGNEWGRGYAQASKDLAQGIEQLVKDSQ